jgi:hypothetical protein
MATGSLSIVGSSLILLSIYRNRSGPRPQPSNRRRSSVYRPHSKGQTSHVYLRILAGMSIYDLVYTLFSAMFGLLFKPRESETDRDGYGTRFTCTLQGFFIQWGFGCFAYGAWLSVYYVLTIRYSLSEATLARYVEPVIHSSVFIFYFGTALIASALGLMNPTGVAACWIVPYPISCAYDLVPCSRGTHYKQAILWMILLPSSISVLVILICLALVAQTVWRQRNIIREQNSRLPQPTDRSSCQMPSNATFQPTPMTQEPPMVGGQCVASPEPQQQLRRAAPQSSVDRLANEAVCQCLLFGSTFVNSVIWTNVVFGFALTDSVSKDLYWVSRLLLPPPMAVSFSSFSHWPLRKRLPIVSGSGQYPPGDVPPFSRLLQLSCIHQAAPPCCSQQFPRAFSMVGLG